MAAGGNGDGSEKRQPDKVEITPGCQVWCKTRFEEIQGTVTAYDHENKVIFISILFKTFRKFKRVASKPLDDFLNFFVALSIS